ncbi:MAG: biotin--[acetyl-CoA-carboxylase] ligase [Dokdonella sp.]|uniref:biotin--[acetyl-CoA-carboxylase] ligase n=1 Tax=Dokdonella sp. TaxID=2291710 RepID=UPI003F7DC72E
MAESRTSRSTAAEPSARAVLAELGEHAISGSALAGRLGVSRAAVWKQVERLREAGVGILAQAGSGYRLAAPLELLDEATLLRALAPATRARLAELAVHWQIDSTSSELLRRADRDPRDVIVCLAEMQTAGRGRRGRRWHTPPGGGIALSLLKRFDAGMASLAGLSLAVGVAAVEALTACGIGEVALKWPNDLVARGAKLGGILVELGGDALGPCHAVIGLGLNLRLGAAARAIDQAAIDLAALAPDLSRTRIAASLIDHLVAALDCFAAHGFAAFAAAYARHDALDGRDVDVVRGTERRHGVARGIDARGALRVDFGGREEAVDAGEVSLRLRA